MSAHEFISCTVTASGELFTWGDVSGGKLGHGEGVGGFVPKRVDALQTECVVAAVVGFRHSLAVTRDGSVFSWGYGRGLLPVNENVSASDDSPPYSGIVVWSPGRYPQPQLSRVRDP